MLQLLKTKKGTMGLQDVPKVFLTLAMTVAIGVAGYLVLAGMDNTVTGITDMANKTHGAVGNFTTSMNNIVTYAPTWGTILGVAVLIGIVIGAFYVGKKKFGGESY